MTQLQIVDLSNNNAAEHPDFKQLKKSGFDGVYFKLTEGTTFLDHVSEEWYPAAMKAGLMVGFYHFFRGSGQSEAQFFLSHLPKLKSSKHFRPCLDYEVGTPIGQAARLFNATVHRELNQFPLFYSYADFASQVAGDTPVGAGLWLAAYGRNDGKVYPVTVPKPWKSIVGHQYTSQGRTPGVSGPVDMSVIIRPKALEVK